MKTKFNLQGSERKPLVKAIEELTGRKGMYTMSGNMKYAFDFGGGLALHRDGTLVDADGIFGLLTGLAERGFTGEAEESEPKYRDEEEAAGGDRTDCEDRDEFGDWDGDPTPAYLRETPEQYAEREMRRLKLEAENVPDYSNRGQYGGNEIPEYWDDGMTEEEELGLGRTRREEFQGENGMRADDVPETDTLTVEFPLNGFNPETLDNLTKMVTAKEALIKAALGADDLPIQVTVDTVKFPWFTLADPSHAAYYVQFIFALCKTAKEKKRVTAKERGLADNPKYAMRCWLLSLGLIGDEYKNARKLLLANLDGDSSFKGGSRPTYTVNCYTYPNGEETDAMDCETFDFTSLAKAKTRCYEFLADCESLKFAGAHVEDDNGKYIYEILTDVTVNEK